MRDLVMLVVLPVMLYAMAQRPFIAVGMCLWTALFFPNAWVYGIASVPRYNLLFAAVAIVGYLAWKHKPKIQFTGLGMLVLAFFLWTVGSTMTSIGNPDLSWEIWSRFAKVVTLFVFVVLVIKDKLHFDFVLWCVVLSVGFYADLETLKFLASGGGHNIVGMSGHVLGDRNELALAFVMTLPLCYYLWMEYGKQSRILNLALLGTMGLLALGVIGTQSRGGLVAMLALGAYMFLKSDRKLLLGVLIAVFVIGASFYVSEDYVARVDSIASAGEDGSFMGRVVAWKLSFIMAMEHPFFGGGFKSLEYFPVWTELSKSFFDYSWFYTGTELPNTSYARAAHSVYFQVMGDHGFVGLALYLSFLTLGFLKAGKVARKARRAGAPAWLPLAATMVQLSIFAFAVGGAALSLAYFDLLFALFGLVVVLETRLLASVAPLAATASRPLAAPAPGQRLVA
ncbi:putative O-glycosylation ligase, exosortase A system-associated [Massilia sp. Leaf139]|uniref:putative O-glycosylation ligase, exosortase A system-associated n=1 Tax=Massilia sp. Leaf139 TaxID=1736272 RepID=UPI0006F521B7|nr:putative O-glycosylation ligase, exosortase A system-associated [Massilia sp. Leaf139]KQQ87041.1 O-antigen polymerase [Massilia sp. Leaf139]